MLYVNPKFKRKVQHKVLMPLVTFVALKIFGAPRWGAALGAIIVITQCECH